MQTTTTTKEKEQKEQQEKKTYSFLCRVFILPPPKKKIPYNAQCNNVIDCIFFPSNPIEETNDDSSSDF